MSVRGTQAERAAIKRDLVWALLWSRRGNWLKSGAVWAAWLDGRNQHGCAFYPDYIERRSITRWLRILVAEGRAEERCLPRSHPEWRAVEPTL